MTEKQMFDFLVTGGLSEHGAAVLLGHFQAESGLNSRNLQNSFQKRLGHTERLQGCSSDFENSNVNPESIGHCSGAVREASRPVRGSKSKKSRVWPGDLQSLYRQK